MSNFTIFHNVLYAIFILKSFNSHISVVVCSVVESRAVSKWCIREWVNPQLTAFIMGDTKTFSNEEFPLSQLSVVSTMVTGLERMFCGALIKRTPGKHLYLHWPQRYNRNNVENGVKHRTIN